MKNLFRKTKEEQRREKLSDESLGELISLSDLLIDDCISRDDFLLNVLISSGYTKNPEMEEIKTVWDKNKVNKHICRFRNDEGRSCMLKVYLATNCDDMEYLYRKMESVKIDSLPRVLGRGKYKDVYYVIEEYINGKALSKKITDTKDVLEILRLMKKVCDAVMPLHTEFKPAIVLVGLEPIESLYHLTPFNSLTNSNLCSRPEKLAIASKDFSISTISYIADIQAHIFS